MRYYGGKNHLFRQFINLIPEHDRFVELFAGSAAVSRNLARRHAEALVVELDAEQAALLRVELPAHRVLNQDGIALLEANVNAWGRETVIFADPPYPLEDRRDSRARYRCEMTNEQHHRLAELLHATKAKVLVCGHPWGLYPKLYRGWKRHEFRVILRSSKPGFECLWTNYDDPGVLHDYRYFGADKRTRQDHRRQVARAVAKFGRMDRHVRAAVLRELVDRFSSTSRAGDLADGIPPEAISPARAAPPERDRLEAELPSGSSSSGGETACASGTAPRRGRSPRARSRA